MTVQLDLWQLIAGEAAVIVFFIGGIAWFARAWLVALVEGINEQLGELKKSVADHAADAKRVETNFTALRIEIARDYLRREDHIRAETVTGAKLDALAAKMDMMNDRIAHNGH